MLAARLALAAFIAACLAWLASLDTSQHISTDVLDLLPADERSPELSLVRNLAADVQARTVLIALHAPDSDTPPSPDATDAFVRSLRNSNAFADVSLHADLAQRESLARALHERRFTLLLPAWLERMRENFAETHLPADRFAAWTAERAAQELEAFLGQPEAVAMQDLLATDPLLLLPRIVRDLGDFAATANTDASRVLIWARLRGSPLSAAGQHPAFAAIASALAEARLLQPALFVEWTGVNRFAAASRARIQREIAMLNLVSIAAVFAVTALFLRRPWQIIHLLPVVLLSLLGAWTLTTLVFSQVHILVFVIGALLAGVAIDYGFYISLQPLDARDPSYRARLRPLLRPLLTSCATTVIGFSLLLWADLPLLRQIGLFVASGLVCALLGALLWFGAIPIPPLLTRSSPLLERGRFSSPRIPTLLLALALLVALATPFLLNWRDDIRELEIPSPELRANDRRVRALFGDTSERTAYLTFGDTLARARERLEALRSHLHAHASDPSLASLGLLFPTESAWRSAPSSLRQLEDFPALFRAALERHAFDPAAFESFFNAWTDLPRSPAPGSYEELYRDLWPHLPAPLAQTASPFAPRPWFVTLVDAANLSLPASLDTIPIRQLETFNTLFARYRSSAVKLSLIGLALVAGSVLVVYRDRRALRIGLIPIGACFFSLGLFSLLGHSLNLFHLLGAFLGVCLAHDYAIFTAETARARALPPTAVRVSALTTLASFAVLGFSQIPVVHALGTTVALTVSMALIAIELEARSPRRP